MRYGVNINWTDLASLAPRARGIGLDYVELRVGEALSPLNVDDSTFRTRVAEVERLGLPVEAANVFVTPPVMVVGPEADLEQFRAYATTAVERLRAIGAPVVVWGSGPTRTIPEGFPRERAWAQFRERVALAAELCEPAGLRIALEALPRTAVNFIHRIGECWQIAEEVASSAPGGQAVGIVADNLHMMKEEEDYLLALRRCAARIFHVHVADSNGRAPSFGGGYDFGPFAATLRALGYDGRVTIEARVDLERELPDALAFLRRVFR
ncbi:MAG TPA: sugar phosphate isomerase/epimerase family protein [Chloroflexota bacterium]|jgi:sugar phosphate isomerase/epimerase|nr:sugar phosphate isomerase/epimerase family protein [Chloroflexota bacterium]